MAGHGHQQQPVDVFRKSVIIAILFVGLLALFAGGGAAEGATTGLLALGFVILASYTIGELAEVAKLPHITGYLLAGVVLGESAAKMLHGVGWLAPYLYPPFDLGLLNEDVLHQLGLIDTLALALICLTAGGELKLESLKDGLWRILGILGAQTVTVMVGVTALFVAISQPWSPLPFDKVVGLELSQSIALGAVLASVALATAPAATIAVINSLGAKGPMTSNVLPVVVLKDVVVVIAFSAATAIAIGVMGASEGSGFGAAIGIIVASIVLGLVIGVGLHLYLRYVNAELLLFIVGMIFATAELTTWVTHLIDPEAHAELALVFIAAGFAVANTRFSDRGHDLIHEVERLSLPVYVVFFTMAGAKLHIEDLISSWRFALLLVGTRIAMLWAGVAIGALVPGTDAMTRRYGWMGFVSQAGLALTLADTTQKTFGGDVGNGLFSLILAGVALNEILGPVLLQFGLGFAGETAAQRQDDDAPEVDAVDGEEGAPGDGLTPWKRLDDEPEAWGPPPETASAELNELATEVELELRQLVRDLERGPLVELGAASQAYLRGLRRNFLRFHRKLATTWSQDPDPSALPSFLRAETALLAERWRDHLLARSTALGREGWSPVKLQEAVDQVVSNLPELVHAPLEPGVLPSRAEPGFARLSRAWLRLRDRLSTVTRDVHVHALGRYHFQGHVAGRMEGLAALTVNAELHLANRTSALFDTIDDATERLAALVTSDPDRIGEAIEALREEVEQDFRFALDEVSWVARDAHLRATHILGNATRAFKEDLAAYDTPDLPPRKRRYARVFDSRTRGLTALTEGFASSRDTLSSRYAALALVFEVVGLEAQVKEAVDAHTDRLRRQIRGKGLTQLARVREALDALITQTDTLLQPSERTGPELAAELKIAVEPVERIVDDVVDTTLSLRDWLASEGSDEPLLDAILDAAQDLSERYDVPVGKPVVGEWVLPAPIATTEIPFREVTISFIEAHITRDLIDVTRRLAAQVDGLVAALQELQRVLSFNAELAQQELEVHVGDLAEDTRQLVRDIVLGSWGRSQTRLGATWDTAHPLPETIDGLVNEAVLAKLDTFRNQVLDGRIVDLRHTLIRQVRVQGRLLSRAGSVTEIVSSATGQIADGLSQTLGDERIAALRYSLGLKETVEVANPEAFAAPVPLARLPTVYRRLFSDHALEAGDLLTGRDLEYTEALETLRNGGPGLFRSVALVGLDTIGRRALASAVVRGLGEGRVTRHTLEAPVSVEDVDGWFGEEPGGVVVLENPQHLFVLRPGGFGPLRRFVRGIVEDSGRTAFIVLVDTPVWHFAVRSASVDTVFARVLPMRPLTADELEAALVSRHSMSGYGVRFESSTDLSWQIQDFLSRTEDASVRHQKTWFRTLHQASGGLLHDALQLWMASVLDIDETAAVMRLGPVPMPPISRLRRLPEPTLLTLRQVASQGWSTPELHAGQFRTTVEDAQTHLASLAHAGLLRRDEGVFTLPPHLVSPIITVLTARGWFR